MNFILLPSALANSSIANKYSLREGSSYPVISPLLNLYNNSFEIQLGFAVLYLHLARVLHKNR